MSRTLRSFPVDFYTKVVLTAIALLLAGLAFRPVLAPVPVRAQADWPRFYIEPGSTLIRKPGGDLQLPGKMVVDLETGDIWGFPTNQDFPYPVDYMNNKPAVSPAVYLGRYDFAGMKRTK
jgi:hypothetical protein